MLLKNQITVATVANIQINIQELSTRVENVNIGWTYGGCPDAWSGVTYCSFSLWSIGWPNWGATIKGAQEFQI